MELFEGSRGEQLRTAALVAAWLLVAFLAVQVVSGMTSLRYIGAGLPATNTITVSGYGEVFAVPDIATFSFSVVSQKATVEAAQEDATTKINAVTQYLKDAGIEEKDIKTTDYSVYPRYEYQNSICPQPLPAEGGVSSTVYCPPGRSILTGYEVRQTTSIKVRDTGLAGELLAGVGSRGATEVSSLTFTFDDPEGVQDEARGEAIADAKEKADDLAKQLGVRLVRVVSFGESGRGYPVAYPEAYGLGGAVDSVKATAPDISIGENKVTSNVSVTYEIR